MKKEGIEAHTWTYKNYLHMNGMKIKNSPTLLRQ
ncbi:uncharacterized protein METZ01_LOCUS497685 [marine metagenome]|uniref:Uncharacterized protein n=1 Tax=marine metagenome TaxID=408172 RepID=A0A383DK54_9ZZZZ